KLDNVLAESAIAGIHNLFQFRNDRLWSRITDRKYAYGLSAHPVDVEAQYGLDRGTTFGAAALNEQHVACGVGTYRPGLRREAVEQLDQRGGGNVTQRNGRHAIARLGMCFGRIKVASSNRIA